MKSSFSTKKKHFFCGFPYLLWNVNFDTGSHEPVQRYVAGAPASLYQSYIPLQCSPVETHVSKLSAKNGVLLLQPCSYCYTYKHRPCKIPSFSYAYALVMLSFIFNLACLYQIIQNILNNKFWCFMFYDVWSGESMRDKKIEKKKHK